MGVAERIIEPAEAGPNVSPIFHLNDGFRKGLNPSYALRAGYSTETRMTPDLVMPSARAALIDTSMTLLRMKGPLSLIRHLIDRPAPVTVTMLPNGRVRWAQVISPL